MGRKSASGFGIRDEQPGSNFLELRNHFFGLKYLNSLMRIRDGDSWDPGWIKVGSGIRYKHPGSIPDPQHWFNADPDPAFNLKADLDQESRTIADPCRSRSGPWLEFLSISMFRICTPNSDPDYDPGQPNECGSMRSGSTILITD
jgi:hypothetical protein